MTRQQFLQRMEEIYLANVEISRRKNADYANGDNPFQNFQTAEAYNRSTAEGLFFRMCDKMSRVGNGLRQELQVKDESILDTLSDLCNYSVILRMWIEENRNAVQLSDAPKTSAPLNSSFPDTTGIIEGGIETEGTGDFRIPTDLTRIEDDPNAD